MVTGKPTDKERAFAELRKILYRWAPAMDVVKDEQASYYLDTRHVRRWVLDNLADQAVLNTFAYTGSLGVAAVAAGASRVPINELPPERRANRKSAPKLLLEPESEPPRPKAGGL